MFAFVGVDEVQQRLEWDLDAGEQRVAEGAIEDLSGWAVFYGRAGWAVGDVPHFIKNLIVRAAARYMRNPDGYQQSRAGDETVVWSERSHMPGSAEFTPEEIAAIKASLGGAAFGSVQTTAWDTRLRPSLDDEYVPVYYGGEPFPFGRRGV